MRAERKRRNLDSAGTAGELDPYIEALLMWEPEEVQQEFFRRLERDKAEELYRKYRTGSVSAGADRAVDGDAFLDEDSDAEPVWGAGGEVLWAKGEGLLITGPQGVGKSTLAQQLAKARLGLLDEVFGYPVVESEETGLYLAMDRPAQIRRSMLRMFTTPAERRRLRERLVVWKGPLPFDPTADPDQFAEWVAKVGRSPGWLIVDSYKDLANGLTDDRVGAGANACMQRVLAHGTDWIGLHHHRKSNGDNRKPNRLDDVYGSVWLTAGTGSVVLLWGQPGDATVELSHLKQPAERVGPLTITHSHGDGESVAVEPIQKALDVLERAGEAGITEVDVALAVYSADDDSARKRARRLLKKLTTEEVATFEAAERGGRGGGAKPARWRWAG